MKKYIILSVVVFCYAFAKASIATTSLTEEVTFFQKFVSHEVKKGETVYSISKKYNVSQDEIFKLNPDAKKKIYEGLTLTLPETVAQVKEVTQEVTQEEVVQEGLKFKTHKVRRKETLYSISKKYGVPQEVIKRYNKQLYSQTLRKGDKIKVPINYSELNDKSVVELPEDSVIEGGYLAHKVIAKETKYGIARKYDITIAELDALNPEVKEGLKEGIVIKVPQRSYAESAVIDENKFAFYEVEKGNTMYSLLRSFKIEADELLELNPALDNGLKEGMILKVPKGTPGSHNPQSDNGGVVDGNMIIAQGVKASLLDSLSDFSKKRIAIMLPFGVSRVDKANSVNNERLLKGDRILRISLDMYSGMLMAADDAKAAGITSIIDTYDTAWNKDDGEATNVRKIDDIIESNDFQNTQAVIGPLLGYNVNRASGLLNDINVPVISPMSSNINGNQNIFLSRPDDIVLRDKMLSYIQANAEGKNIVIIADKKSAAAKEKIQELFPEAKMVQIRTNKKGKQFVYGVDVSKQLSRELVNWVILETNDVPIISTATTTLNAELSKKKITLFTTDKGNAYKSDEIQHTHLRNLAFHFPSVSKEYKYSTSKEFIEKYEEMYNINPSEDAIRGYDLMYDTLLRLTYANDLYTAAKTGIETDYIENKFKYGMRVDGGFANEAVYLLRYTKELALEEVPFTIEEEE